MGLAIGTGVLAYLLRFDRDGAEWTERSVELLLSNDLPPHEEPRQMPATPHRGECGSFSYSFLHYLRRAVAYSRRPWRERPLWFTFFEATTISRTHKTAIVFQ